MREPTYTRVLCAQEHEVVADPVPWTPAILLCVLPMQENVAAGLLLASGWDPETQSLADPMCGSGTLVIEAALIAMRRAPGLLAMGISGGESLSSLLFLLLLLLSLLLSTFLPSLLSSLLPLSSCYLHNVSVTLSLLQLLPLSLFPCYHFVIAIIIPLSSFRLL